MLKTLIDNTRTDKGTTHSYLDVYENKFKRLKDTATNILEIGIRHGASIKLWNDYFRKATIYGIDIININGIDNIVKNNDLIKLITSTDAYNQYCIDKNFVEKNIKFDIIIDDGIHSLWSMKYVAENYSKLLTDNGILVIEDIQNYEWIPEIIAAFPQELRDNVEVFDLRKIKNRYDDILIILDKQI